MQREKEKKKEAGVGAGVEEQKRRVCRIPQCIKSRREDAEVEERARASLTVRFAGTGTFKSKKIIIVARLYRSAIPFLFNYFHFYPIMPDLLRGLVGGIQHPHY